VDYRREKIMPRGLGVFNRTNGQFQGAEIWQDDLEQQIKIVALRHDTHDEDLAVGIAGCLPKDGSEPMLNSFDAGGFEIVNAGGALLPSSVPTFGQTITAASWNAITEQLTLTRVDLIDLVVTIPLLGGGGGTLLTGVQRIVAGNGIAFGNGNEMSTGNDDDTISIANSGATPGSYVNPNVTVDATGRITSITSGNSSGTDLSIQDRNAHSFLLVSSTGTNVTIPAATDALSGLMTADLVNRIIALEDSGAGMKPPLGLYGMRDAGIIDLIPSVTGWILPTNENSGDANGVWTSLRTETGAGIVDFLALRLKSIGIDNITLGVRLLVDGNVVWQDSSFYPNMVAASNPQDSDVVFIGADDGIDDGGAASQMLFNTGWEIQVKANSNVNNTFDVYARYQSDEPYVE
jgi:hypothetical protein